MLTEQAPTEEHDENPDQLSVVFTGSSIVDPKTMVIGMWLDIYCTRMKTWYPAKVVKLSHGKVRVQFHGWQKKFNEWVSKVCSTGFCTCHVHSRSRMTTIDHRRVL